MVLVEDQADRVVLEVPEDPVDPVDPEDPEDLEDLSLHKIGVDMKFYKFFKKINFFL